MTAEECVTADEGSRAARAVTESSWEPVPPGESSAVLRPEVLFVTGDGYDDGLLYAGRVNALIGQTTAGKSWAAALAVAEELRDTWDLRYAVVFDYEATRGEWEDRLRLLGVSEEALRERLIYISPREPFTHEVRRILAGVLSQRYPTLAIVDSLSAAMSVDGLRESDPVDVKRWADGLPRFLTAADITVLVVDHAGKDDSARFARESIAKMEIVSGAAYQLRAVRPFSRLQPGHSTVICSKDRHGYHAVGEHVGDLVVEPGPDGTVLRPALRPPGTASKGSRQRARDGGEDCTQDVLLALREARQALGKVEWREAAAGIAASPAEVSAAIKTLTSGEDAPVSVREVRRGRTRKHLCWPADQPEKAPQ